MSAQTKWYCGETCPSVNTGAYIVDDGQHEIAEVFADLISPEEAARRTRLIAAAPDMLEALQDAEKRLRGAGMLGGEDDLVRVAIAKAKGE